MTLKRKVLALYTAAAVIILAVVGGGLSARFRHDRLEALRRELLNQLKYIDFALTSFMVEVESDVATLAAKSSLSTLRPVQKPLCTTQVRWSKASLTCSTRFASRIPT
jgi:hypothetical protein